MALTQPYYNLKNVRVTLKTGVTVNATRIRIKRNPVYEEKWPGHARVPQQVYLGERLPEIVVEVYNDETLNFGEILPNQAVQEFELLSPDDGASQSFLQSDFLTKFPPESMVFGEPETELVGDRLSVLRFPIRCNVLNPGPDGVAPEGD